VLRNIGQASQRRNVRYMWSFRVMTDAKVAVEEWEFGQVGVKILQYWCM